MDEREDIGGEYRRPSFSPIRNRHLAPSPIKKVEEVDKSDEGDEDSSEQITAVESPIVAEPRSGDSGPPYVEDLKEHGRDDTELRVGEPSSPPPEAKGDHPDGEDDKTDMVDERDEECNEDNSGEITAVESSIMAEPRSSDSGSCIDDLELHVGESSPPPPEAKGDHPDGEDEDNTETLRSNTSSAEPLSTRSANQENDSLDNRMPSRGISTMKMAVKSGDPKAVDDLLERLSDTLVVDELTTTYGGNGVYSSLADEDDLFNDTSPILHAARSGNLAVFESVMKAMQAKLSQEQVKEMLAKKDRKKQSLLSLAARSGSKDVLESVLLVIQKEFTKSEVEDMISCGYTGYRLLEAAAASGRVEMFNAVIATISDKIADEEVKEMISGSNGYWLLMAAAESGRVEMFNAVIATISDMIAEEEVGRIILLRRDIENWLLSRAVKSKSVELFKVVMVVVVDNLPEEEVGELLCYNAYGVGTPLGRAIMDGNLDMCKIILRKVQDHLGHPKMQNELDAAFLLWEKLYVEDDDLRCKITLESRLPKILSMLVRHSARPPTEFLQWAARDVTDGKEHLWPIFTESLLMGVESASNPLIPGMNLSVPLAEAAEGAREGERKRLLSLQKRVDEYVLEVLERLPQTIQGFDTGMSQCSALFEPEGPQNDPCGRPGPLRVAFKRRQQMESLCAVPLVMDYLSRRFTSGLPNMRYSSLVLHDEDDVGGGPVLGDSDYSFLRNALQGADADVPSLTILPGAQFIIAGLLAKPNIYYRVPAMRMALDFVVYIIMLYFYSSWVLLQEDGPLTIAEIFFAVYVLAGVLTEAAEIRRNPNFYRQDPWNFFDALAFVMLAGGFFVRLANGDNPCGRALYALSAPLVFSRILFFVQILQFQGPMIQVMFSMGMVLLQFAVVLLVVMMGFAMALYPLLRDDNGFTPYAILLLLFRTLLGDVEAFDEFDESTQNRYSIVGRLLLVVYLVVMTIMLLNLLIAVLSTKHAKVDVNVDKEFKVSRARIIEHYRLAVAFDILPAPFNILQLVLRLPFLLNGKSAAHTKIKIAVGQVSFWLVLSPLVYAGGIMLWVTSSMYYLCQPSKLLDMVGDQELLSKASNYVLAVFWCALGAPLCLLAFWLRQPFLAIYNGVIALIRRLDQGKHGDSSPPASARGNKNSEADVQKMLKDAGTGASDLRKYLEDPMCDPKVRPDEVDRGTTVKHMKLLRDRLENKFSEHVDHLRKEFNERDDHLEKKFNERIDSLEKNTNALVSETNRKVELVLEMLRGK